jgi:hypothetical protein
MIKYRIKSDGGGGDFLPRHAPTDRRADMNAIAMNGTRTLVSEIILHTNIGAMAVPVLRPTIPIGEPCLPLTDMVMAFLPDTGLETAKKVAAEWRRMFADGGVPPQHLQVLITPERGAIETVSATIAICMARALSPGLCESLTAVLVGAAVSASLEKDCGCSPAMFECLTSLHECSGSRRGMAPGHWYQRRGKAMTKAADEKAAMAAAREGKGVWRTEDGAWWADHNLAIDYATYLFPAFHVWMIEVVSRDPGFMSIFQRAFGDLISVSVSPAPPAEGSAPKITLVHDANAEQPVGGA